MLKPINPIPALFVLIFTIVCLPWNSYADDSDFSEMEMSFKNFITCELTRTEATNPFSGKPFKITMIDLFDVQMESDLQIVTGAVQCFVDNQSLTLYVAVGIIKLLEKEQVSYYTIRDKDFSILATELFRFPYKERCKWSQYWVDID
ncbi:MAG: hypothetical protein A3J85_06760 [Desulfobacula sp. RIFOXYA12_FULL_46_16]|nr:MAG: hypothetical protein A2464_13310 [Deltaproteobacteria bacterium RIFOXYC2_FULL_48_10]OGR20180.1 MAG: hypothetical protein A3J85_06760 [Desulfobacula sp. RIFOXYA12_FULL_46_16]OGR61742.1 MAG: hypothetical protein A3J80_00560 [Desulfobacula sp. RIFOXYB2_FULL_45_6]